MVYIKRVETGDTESEIATMLSTEDLLRDPRNHSVPILELIRDPDDPNISYMVMPFLRLMDDPPFEYIEEIIDFVDQILEVGHTSIQSCLPSESPLGSDLSP